MTLVAVLAGVLAAALAAANGANDVSKGVATLAGTGVTTYRRAIAWGTLWTTVGALAGAVLGAAMLATFATLWHASATAPAALATLVGAGGWVALATWARWPVSTTHALTGALVGVGVLAFGAAGVRWDVLGGKVVAPLALTPLVGGAAAAGLIGVGRAWAALGGGPPPTCWCVDPGVAGGPGALGLGFMGHGPGARVGTVAGCAVHRGPRVTAEHLHWLSSGAVSFARGLNDGPKLAMLALAVPTFLGAAAGRWLAFALVALGMAAGSWFAGRRVTTVLAEDVTVLDPGSGCAANVATAGLVGAGALWGWPMSTTHVAGGALVGVGAARGRASVRWGTVRTMLFAWVVTLPAAALLGIVGYGVMVWLG